MRRWFVIGGGLVALAAVAFLAAPVVLLLAPPKLRDYPYHELAYRVIADNVTNGATGELQVAQSLLRYISSHETAPSAAQVVDQTVFNDLVRGIGFCDQQAWGLSTLLAKEGIPATLLVLRGRHQVSEHSVATVYLNREWRILDPYHHLSFLMPSGDPATFEDLQRDPRLIRTTNPKLEALEPYKKGFADYYAGLYDPHFPPDKWGALTDSKNLVRRLVSAAVDDDVWLFGNRFVYLFQDLYLRRALGATPEADLFLRARHYDLFLRRDLALKNYQQLLAEYPASLYTEDVLYFLGKLYEDRRQWKEAGDAFDQLLARFGPRTQWADTAHYFNGLANEAQRNWQKAENGSHCVRIGRSNGLRRSSEQDSRDGQVALRDLSSLARRAWKQVVPGRRPMGELLLVADSAGWILDEVAQQLAAHMPADVGACSISSDWVGARDCTIHFIDRAWAWNDGLLDRVAPSNRLIGVWWHGRLDSPDPIIQASLERMRALQDRFCRLQVTCSSGRHTLEALGIAPGKIVMLPVGVDLGVFRPPVNDAARQAVRQALGVDEATTVIGCFQKDGNGWGEGAEPKLIKGPDILVDALALLHARYPIHALVPGPARGYVTRRLKDAGIPFSAPGMIPRADLPRLYHALDVYLSPSRDEGGPAGALEAMASGVAVVSSRSGIPADLIQHGVNGLLVEVEDVDAMAAAVASLVESPARRRSLGNHGLTSIQPYDWKPVTARYAAELYRQ